MNGKVVQGWHSDPFGIHEARYFSAAGEPTRLVRDRGVESYDEPPSGADEVAAAMARIAGWPEPASGYPPQDAYSYGQAPAYPVGDAHSYGQAPAYPGGDAHSYGQAPAYPGGDAHSYGQAPAYPGGAYGGYGTAGPGPQGAGPYGGPGPGPGPGPGQGPGPGPGPSGPGFYGRPPAPKPGLVPLRPLSLGEILDGAFSAMRWNPKTVLTSSAAVAVISAVMIALVSYSAERWALTNVRVSGSNSQVNLAGAGAFAAIGGATGLVLAFANLVLTGLLTVAVSQGVLGIKETLAGAWRTLRPRIWRLTAMLLLLILFLGGGWLLGIGLSVLAGALLGAGAHQSAAGVIVGVVGSLTVNVFAVIALVRWSVAIPVLILERSGPLKSLGRSWRLVRRSSWRVFGMLLLTEIIVVIANEIINVPFAVASGGFSALNAHAQQVNVGGLVVAAVGQVVAYSVTAPLLAGAIVLVYTDLRMRREGLDITLQAAAAGTPAGGRPDGPTAAPW